MSAQRQPKSSHRPHLARRRHRRNGRDTAVASPLASSGLSWITPPRTSFDLQALRREVEPCLLIPHRELRRGFSAWFLHMLEMGLLTGTELAPLISGEHGLATWGTLCRTTHQRLADQLNALIHAHDTKASAPCASSLTMSLKFDEQVVLLLTLGGYCEFDVDSLHHQPSEIAAWAYTTLELIGTCLAPCLTPAVMWDGDELGWSREEHREEYARLCAAGVLKDLSAAAELVRKGNFETFSTHEPDLAQQLDLAREMFEGRPSWMRTDTDQPITRAHQLRQSARRYHAHAPAHPWVHFVEVACEALCQRFADDEQFTKERALRNKAIQPIEDNETNLSGGLWVTSGAEPETYNAQDFFECMSNAGEFPTMRIGLVGLPTAVLKGILHDMAIGIGLLFRAHTTDEHITHRV